MKRRFTYLLPLLTIVIALLGSCAPNKPSDPVPNPNGTFAGEFRRLHRSTGASKIDTLKANISVTLNSDFTYKVTGDTSTVHAGSIGLWNISANSIKFQDNTYSATSTIRKVRLFGEYDYAYDGTSLKIAVNSVDTLSLQYDLKRVN
ncbi:hypothetical protein [Mucilaginibacter psychrotolerans]|uniref:Lipocalin-like domain-containing protein n=1 Tax=Mucilaginibacter psychrotolerans TaxID=1524096 RepID=A0A4Y8SA09_9SPHI|nr:hypothetical protein [Mucilaginibacter psychrotolerans]TFF35387.1 hypothetical protein E2R66_19215 [Mucilaginibacter psychrotolerans]